MNETTNEIINKPSKEVNADEKTNTYLGREFPNKVLPLASVKFVCVQKTIF
jgi:hypothetical protein